MSSKKWMTGYLILLIALLAGVFLMVVLIDPFFHYHKPLKELYYTLDNERSQNDGMLKHFDYNAVSTGTSLTANTKISEVDELFDVDAIKAQFSGGSYFEINRNLETAFDHQDIGMVIRCLDMAYLLDDKDLLRIDMGEYPDYLYDDNLWNDTKYIYNRDVVFQRCIPMLLEAAAGREGGITTFDDYGDWMDGVTFGADEVLGGYYPFYPPPPSSGLTEAEAEAVRANIRQNLTSIAAAHPETTFYYYFSPVSAAWWGLTKTSGDFFRITDAERIAVEEILPYENIHLFLFSDKTDVTTDLSNYKDALHYGDWINSDILHWIKEGDGELTPENYEEKLAEEQEFYLNYDYNQLFDQMKS